ncbi:hypothetical protein Aph01nite_76320 [Acrocarpospora phusangensis]|uniref:Glycoside hydrolase family 5 domain-containing protein n=1 Tax=Acrocarpospora phusangensis TaxID=1070424 RepID=A0A919QNE1_9ACTN|nr:cellulase family glycosylhydrolase [Acrocarpospora phusangensis]GIH29322.1 hypothetical protein Aph01nite_76320 [Acrocarpospora phusangensis]
MTMIPAFRAARAGTVTLALLLLAGAALDPSKLVALYSYPGGHRLGSMLVYLPLWLGGFAVGSYVLGRRRGSGFLVTVGVLVASAMFARFAASLVSVIGALPAWSTVRFVAWSTGFTGVFAGLLGWPAAIPAWLILRREKPGQPARPVPELTIMAAFTGVAGLLLVSRAWWTHSPLGYAFGQGWWFIAPTAEAGVIGGLVGLAVFLAFVHVAGARLAHAPGRSGTFAGAWLACVCGGLGLGMAQSVLALFASGPADSLGSDLWVLPATLLRLALGVSYGAAVGLVAATALVALPARLRGPRAARLAAAVLLLGPLTVEPVPPATPSLVAAATGDGMPRLSVSAPAIVDDRGRQVLLRGVNLDLPLTEGDLGDLAASGANVVRLGISWSRLEPTPGVWDTAYLDSVKAAVGWAESYGVYTVLNLRQDRAATGLYATWGRLAAEFASRPAVAGFDLMNEPPIGAQPPLTSSLLLGRDYAEAVTAIRSAERAAGGFPHLIFFQPSVLWSELGFDAAPPPGFSADANLVFAPHPPAGSPLVSIRRALAMSARMASRYGAALWIGEWSGDPGQYAVAEDAGLLGGALRAGETRPAELSRAYPRATPGRLTGLWSDARRRGLRLSGTGGGGTCDLDVWVPGEERPSAASTGISSVAFREVPGGWRISGCPSGDYRLELV